MSSLPKAGPGGHHFIPSRPRAKVTMTEECINVILRDYQGQLVDVLQTTPYCGPDGHFYYTIETSDGARWGCSGKFLDFVDKTLVPETHLKHPAATHAWLACHYRDEAYPHPPDPPVLLQQEYKTPPAEEAMKLMMPFHEKQTD